MPQILRIRDSNSVGMTTRGNLLLSLDYEPLYNLHDSKIDQRKNVWLSTGPIESSEPTVDNNAGALKFRPDTYTGQGLFDLIVLM